MKIMTLAVAALGLAVVGAGGWAAWNSTGIAHRDAGGGVMSVDVVPPTEPDLGPGSIMTVGDLSEGYVHDPAGLEPLAALGAEDDAYLETAWVEADPPVNPPSAQPPTVTTWDTPRAATPVRLAPNDYSFGFDQPLPDDPGREERGLD